MVGRLVRFNRAENNNEYMKRCLKKRIKAIVSEEYKSDKEITESITQYIIGCFDKTGIVETYKELGWRKWKQMIIEYVREVTV